MTIFDFANEHWLVTLLIIWSVLTAIKYIVSLPFRALNIYKHGWPTAPHDADGDIHYTSSENKEEK